MQQAIKEGGEKLCSILLGKMSKDLLKKEI